MLEHPLPPAIAEGPPVSPAAPGPSASSPPASAPSLFRYAPALVLLLIVLADAHQLTDPDLWGHLRFGQAALAAGHLIKRDPYSYSAFGWPWHNHEWLTELVMGWLYGAFGVAGLKLWKFVCTAATIVLLADALAATGASAALQMNLLLIAALAIMPQMQFRPQLFSFTLMTAIIAILARHTYRGRAPLWLAVPIMTLWANLHGGFIMGLAALVIYAAAATAQDLFHGHGFRRGLRLGVLALAAILATLATPYGIGTWTTVLHALHNPVTRIAVTDWQPLLFALAHQWHHYPPGVIFYLCVLVVMTAFMAGLFLAPTGDDFPLTAIAIVTVIAAFAAVRNMPFAVITSAIPAAYHLGPARQRRRSEASLPSSADLALLPALAPSRSPMNQWFLAAIAFALAIYLGLFSTHIAEDSYYPAGAVAFIRTHHLHGNLLCDFDWGEYLIWHLAPATRVFIDGRYDTVYPSAVINDYIHFLFALPGAAQVLQGYPHDFILIPPGVPARPIVDQNPHWKLVYRDDGSRLYARAGSNVTLTPPPAATAAHPSPRYFPD